MKQNKKNQIIYFFPDPQVGGVEKNFYIISKYLSRFFKYTYVISGNNINNKIDNKIKLIKINKLWSIINRRLLFIICSIKLFLATIKFKNSIIFSFQGNFYAILVSILVKKKIIIRSNLSPEGWGNSFFKKKIFKFLLSKADSIIVNSDDFRKQMKKKFFINSTTIFNPINIKKINKQSIYKKQINFFEKKTINLINVGRLVEQKNQIEILLALSKLKKLIINYRLLIIGSGPQKEILNNFIIKNKLKKIVKIIFVKKSYKYIKMADAFILSSKYEGLPNTLLEAASLNKYIISSNCKTGPREIMNEYKYGELYKTNNPYQLYLSLKQLKKENFLKKRKDFSKYLLKFESKKNLEKYLEIINKLL